MPLSRMVELSFQSLAARDRREALRAAQCGFLPEGSCRGEDRYGGGGVLEVVGQGGNIGSDLMPLVGIDDIAAAELEKDLACEVANRVLDRRRVGKPYTLAVIADPDAVPAGRREPFGCGFQSGRDDIPGEGCYVGSEPVAEALDLGPADARGEGIESIAESPVVQCDVDVFRKLVDDTVDLRKGGTAFEGHRVMVRDGEEDLQDPADPDVLLQDDRRPPRLGCHSLKDFSPVPVVQR